MIMDKPVVEAHVFKLKREGKIGVENFSLSLIRELEQLKYCLKHVEIPEDFSQQEEEQYMEHIERNLLMVTEIMEDLRTFLVQTLSR